MVFMAQYMTSKELSQRIHYSVGYINQQLKDKVFFEGTHYIRPFGKTLFIWEAVENELLELASEPALMIPMAKGRSCYG